MESVEFEMPKSQCDVIREISGVEPAEIAKKYLVEYSRDGRATPEETVIASVSWLPEVWSALVEHIGIGGISDYIRAATFAAAKKDKIALDKVETWKFGHKETAGRRRRLTSPKVQPGRQSIVCPIVLPRQWHRTPLAAQLSGDLGCDMGRYIKAATQNRLQKDTGVTYPVQRGMGDLVDH